MCHRASIGACAGAVNIPGPSEAAGRRFFLPAPQAGKSAGKKARSCLGESLRQGGGRRASGPRDALHIRPGGGAGRVRKIVSISACCDAPCRTVGKKGAALPEHCRITV